MYVMITIFSDFCLFSVKKISALSLYFQNMAVFRVKNDNCFSPIVFRQFFRQKIVKIMTSVPVSQHAYVCKQLPMNVLNYINT
jgi:hypothetical protein